MFKIDKCLILLSSALALCSCSQDKSIKDEVMYQINKPIEFAGDMAVKAGDMAAKATKPVTDQVLDPFIDRRREAGKMEYVGESTLDKVAICYNSLTTSPKSIKKLANKECAKTKRVAIFSYQDEFSCSILMPTRAYFNCVTK